MVRNNSVNVGHVYAIFSAISLVGCLYVVPPPKKPDPSPIRVYIDPEISGTAAEAAVGWINNISAGCLVLMHTPWPYTEVPVGVISIESGVCGKGLQGCVTYNKQGLVKASIKILPKHQSPESVLIAHELAHILAHANDARHTRTGVLASTPKDWGLPVKYKDNIRLACTNRVMPPEVQTTALPR